MYGTVRDEKRGWEIAIKLSLGKLKLPTPIERFFPEQLAANRFRPLDIGFRISPASPA